MKKIFGLLAVLVLAISVTPQIDTTYQASEYRNIKGGIELPAIEIAPNHGAWQKSKKHIYNKDTVRVLVKTYHSTASGLGVDTIMNTTVYIDTIKADSAATGDSLGGKPCFQTKELLNTSWFFGFVHDTSVLKR